MFWFLIVFHRAKHINEMQLKTNQKNNVERLKRWDEKHFCALAKIQKIRQEICCCHAVPFLGSAFTIFTMLMLFVCCMLFFILLAFLFAFRKTVDVECWMLRNVHLSVMVVFFPSIRCSVVEIQTAKPETVVRCTRHENIFWLC